MFSYGVNWHSTTSATFFLELSFHLYPDHHHLVTLHFSHSPHLRWLSSFPADDAQPLYLAARIWCEMVDACASLCGFASQLRRNIDRTFCIFSHSTHSESKDSRDHMELKKRLKRDDEIYHSLSNSVP